MEKAITHYNDWQGTIALDSIDTTNKDSLNSLFKEELQNSGQVIKFKINSENLRNSEEPKLNMTIWTNKSKKYQKEISFKEFSKMFLKLEIIVKHK